MPRNAMKPSNWAAFVRILDTIPAGHHASSNVLRDLLAAADIPEKSRGGLFSQAAHLGYLEPVRYEASSGTTAKRSVVRIYRKAKPQVVAA